MKTKTFKLYINVPFILDGYAYKRKKDIFILFIYLFTYLFIYLFIYLFTDLFIYSCFFILNSVSAVTETLWIKWVSRVASKFTQTWFSGFEPGRANIDGNNTFSEINFVGLFLSFRRSLHISKSHLRYYATFIFWRKKIYWNRTKSLLIVH